MAGITRGHGIGGATSDTLNLTLTLWILVAHSSLGLIRGAPTDIALGSRVYTIASGTTSHIHMGLLATINRGTTTGIGVACGASALHSAIAGTHATRRIATACTTIQARNSATAHRA